MTRINTNVPSLVAQTRLQRSNDDLQNRLTRLSTGLRINSGADDPAGLIASEALRSEVTSLNKALSNTRRADQIIATADSALAQVNNLLNDIRGLVVEASSRGGLSDDEISANQLQIDSSLEAINRIAQTTTFQGRKLLDGSLDFTTAGGANISKISALNVQKANLGTSGSVGVDVVIESAATQASIEVENIPAGTNGTGTITLNNVAPNTQAETSSLTTASGGDYTISAKAGGVFDGTAGNAVSVSIVAGETTSLTQATTALQTAGAGGDFNVSVKSTGQFGGHYGNSLTLTMAAGNTSTAQAVSSGQAVNGAAAAYRIKAKSTGQFAGVAGNAVTVNINSTNAVGPVADASVAGNVLTIDVDDAASRSLASIKTALEADAQFMNDFEFEILSGNENTLFRSDGSDDVAGFALNGASSGADAAATVSLVGNALTITVDRNTARSLNSIRTALNSSAVFSNDFNFNVGINDNFDNTGVDDLGPTNFSGGTNVAAEASLTGNNLTITVSDNAASPVSLNSIATALASDSSFDAFDFNVAVNNTFSGAGADDVTDEDLDSGSAGTNTTLTDVISITSPATSKGNGTLTIVQETGLGAPTASVDGDGNITVTVDDAAATSLSQIVDAINDLDGYEAEVTTNNGDSTFTPTTDNFTKVNFSGASPGGLDADVVFELSSREGSEVFNVSAGTTIGQLVNQINLVSDSTGVTAEADGTTLQLRSLSYGSNAFVDLTMVRENIGGNFTPEVGAGVRSAGTDSVARSMGSMLRPTETYSRSTTFPSRSPWKWKLISRERRALQSPGVALSSSLVQTW